MGTLKAVLMGGPRDGQVVVYRGPAVLIPMDSASMAVYDGTQDRTQVTGFEVGIMHGIYAAGSTGHKDRNEANQVRLYWQGWQRLGNR